VLFITVLNGPHVCGHQRGALHCISSCARLCEHVANSKMAHGIMLADMHVMLMSQLVRVCPGIVGLLCMCVRMHVCAYACVSCAQASFSWIIIFVLSADRRPGHLFSLFET
jgi:hypothetical protein